MELHPTGHRRVDDPIPSHPLGKKQESILHSLRERGYWSANCGWIFGTYSKTVRLLESLIPRGLVVRAEEPTGLTGVLAAMYGKTRVTYRPTYGAKAAQAPAQAPAQEAARPAAQAPVQEPAQEPARITLAEYARETKMLGDTVIVTLPDGRSFEAMVVAVMGQHAALETVTLGYGGAASPLYRRDLATRQEDADEYCECGRRPQDCATFEDPTGQHKDR